MARLSAKEQEVYEVQASARDLYRARRYSYSNLNHYYWMMGLSGTITWSCEDHISFDDKYFCIIKALELYTCAQS